MYVRGRSLTMLDGTENINGILMQIFPYNSRPVVPGCAGCAMAHPDFDRSVNPISTRGEQIMPT